MTWSQMDYLSRAARVAELDREEAALDAACAAFAKKEDVARFRRGLEAERLRLIPRSAVRPPPRPTTPAGVPILSQASVGQLEKFFGMKAKHVTVNPKDPKG